MIADCAPVTNNSATTSVRKLCKLLSKMKNGQTDPVLQEFYSFHLLLIGAIVLIETG